MDEILEGEVGRSVTFEGKEYWIRELDPIKYEDIKESLFSKEITSYNWRYTMYSSHLTIVNPKTLISGIIEA